MGRSILRQATYCLNELTLLLDLVDEINEWCESVPCIAGVVGW